MKDARVRYRNMVTAVPADIKSELDLSFKISNRIEALMKSHHLSRKQFADALGKRPCEVTKWLSGQHNFTISTLAMLSAFFKQPIISVGQEDLMITPELQKRIDEARREMTEGKTRHFSNAADMQK